MGIMNILKKYGDFYGCDNFEKIIVDIQESLNNGRE